MKLICLIAFAFLISSCRPGDSWTLGSPDGKLQIRIQNPPAGEKESPVDQLFFQLSTPEGILIDSVFLGLEIEGFGPLSPPCRVVDVQTEEVDRSWERLWGRSRLVRDHFQQLDLVFEVGRDPSRMLGIQFRAYNQGLAFRYIIPEQDHLEGLRISGENTRFSFHGDPVVWATRYDGPYTHQENEFLSMPLSSAGNSHLPFLVDIPGNRWLAITEARLISWSGFHLEPSPAGSGSVQVELEPRWDDPSVAVLTGTPAVSPWRVVMVAESPGKFLESDIIQNLNDPCAISDPSWIQPGKSAWDWWWSNSYAPDAGFKLGSNQETMKYFIDFASEMGWEYQLVDWYWYGPPFAPTDSFENNPSDADATTCNPDIAIPELVEYAAARDVKLLVWLEWHHARDQMDEAFPLYEKWGVAGVKIDFMAREDQEVVDFYNRVVRKAAEHHLLVDFHGAYKPTGISRTYPNLITREGVLGNEYNKWSKRITPEHTVTLAFTRNMLGEMDFTPGGWVHVTPDDFGFEWELPSPVVMTTRAHQLAMMVVYESALQVICDSPYNYRNSPEGLGFLKAVPTTWDETVVVNEQIGDYITVARRSGRDWYIGSMTDGKARELDIPLNFLGEGQYVASIWTDGNDADIRPAQVKYRTREVNASGMISAGLSEGGGLAAILQPAAK